MKARDEGEGEGWVYRGDGTRDGGATAGIFGGRQGEASVIRCRREVGRRVGEARPAVHCQSHQSQPRGTRHTEMNPRRYRPFELNWPTKLEGTCCCTQKFKIRILTNTNLRRRATSKKIILKLFPTISFLILFVSTQDVEGGALQRVRSHCRTQAVPPSP
jgi:hypothetical protein